MASKRQTKQKIFLLTMLSRVRGARLKGRLHVEVDSVTFCPFVHLFLGCHPWIGCCEWVEGVEGQLW